MTTTRRARFLAAVLGALLAPAAHADDGAATLTVEIKTDGDAGEVRIALFADAETYESGPPIAAGVQPAGSDAALFVFEGLEPGTYAIKAHHDVDGDGVMATNVMGIPTEPFGFSNDAPARFGPPAFEAAAFTVGAGENVHGMRIRGGGE